jgi:hypothetical protein
MRVRKVECRLVRPLYILVRLAVSKRWNWDYPLQMVVEQYMTCNMVTFPFIQEKIY